MNKNKKDIILKTLVISLVFGLSTVAITLIVLADIDNSTRFGLGCIIGMILGFVIIYLTEKED